MMKLMLRFSIGDRMSGRLCYNHAWSVFLLFFCSRINAHGAGQSEDDGGDNVLQEEHRQACADPRTTESGGSIIRILYCNQQPLHNSHQSRKENQDEEVEKKAEQDEEAEGSGDGNESEEDFGLLKNRIRIAASKTTIRDPFCWKQMRGPHGSFETSTPLETKQFYEIAPRVPFHLLSTMYNLPPKQQVDEEYKDLLQEMFVIQIPTARDGASESSLPEEGNTPPAKLIGISDVTEKPLREHKDESALVLSDLFRRELYSQFFPQMSALEWAQTMTLTSAGNHGKAAARTSPHLNVLFDHLRFGQSGPRTPAVAFQRRIHAKKISGDASNDGDESEQRNTRQQHLLAPPLPTSLLEDITERLLVIYAIGKLGLGIPVHPSAVAAAVRAVYEEATDFMAEEDDFDDAGRDLQGGHATTTDRVQQGHANEASSSSTSEIRIESTSTRERKRDDSTGVAARELLEEGGGEVEQGSGRRQNENVASFDSEDENSVSTLQRRTQQTERDTHKAEKDVKAKKVLLRAPPEASRIIRFKAVRFKSSQENLDDEKDRKISVSAKTYDFIEAQEVLVTVRYAFGIGHSRVRVPSGASKDDSHSNTGKHRGASDSHEVAEVVQQGQEMMGLERAAKQKENEENNEELQEFARPSFVYHPSELHTETYSLLRDYRYLNAPGIHGDEAKDVENTDRQDVPTADSVKDGVRKDFTGKIRVDKDPTRANEARNSWRMQLIFRCRRSDQVAEHGPRKPDAESPEKSISWDLEHSEAVIFYNHPAWHDDPFGLRPPLPWPFFFAQDLESGERYEATEGGATAAKQRLVHMLDQRKITTKPEYPDRAKLRTKYGTNLNGRWGVDFGFALRFVPHAMVEAPALGAEPAQTEDATKKEEEQQKKRRKVEEETLPWLAPLTYDINMYLQLLDMGAERGRQRKAAEDKRNPKPGDLHDKMTQEQEAEDGPSPKTAANDVGTSSHPNHLTNDRLLTSEHPAQRGCLFQPKEVPNTGSNRLTEESDASEQGDRKRLNNMMVTSDEGQGQGFPGPGSEAEHAGPGASTAGAAPTESTAAAAGDEALIEEYLAAEEQEQQRNSASQVTDPAKNKKDDDGNKNTGTEWIWTEDGSSSYNQLTDAALKMRPPHVLRIRREVLLWFPPYPFQRSLQDADFNAASRTAVAFDYRWPPDRTSMPHEEF
ncbi:unnamed protein product [Amoebophrya sp. A25]|nr:unnamed protein product [Amoebophrya sp. A25]|eukprot:GSA25T00012095001.1